MNKLVKLKNKNVLVTGAAGFLGSHACEELLNLKARVIGFDDLSQGTINNFKTFSNNKNFKFIKGDANNITDISKIFKKNTIHYVLHYAATTGVKRTTVHPLDVLQDIEGIKHILKLSYENNVIKLVFSSSSEVYGEPVELPERETSPLNLTLPYAVVKLVGEKYCQAYYQSYKLATTCLRFFNVYGPRQDSSSYGFVTGIFIKQALHNQSLTVFGNGLMTRNFVYVKDNVQATLLALVTKKVNGEVINIGTGKSITINELAQKIINISGKKLKIRIVKMRNSGEILNRYPDVTRMKKRLGYIPQYSLQEGLKITYTWYQRHL